MKSIAQISVTKTRILNTQTAWILEALDFVWLYDVPQELSLRTQRSDVEVPDAANSTSFGDAERGAGVDVQSDHKSKAKM